MNDSVRLPRPAVYALQVATLATVYYAAARFGLRYATIGQNVSLIWPPTGLAIAALVILGRGAWPGIAVGAFFANAATAIPLGAAAGIAVGNTLEAVIGATLLVRAAGSRPRFDSMGTVRALILMVAPLSAQVSAFIGVGTLVMAGALPAAGAVTAVAFWWTGNVLGALIVTPLLLAWLLHPPPRLARARSARGGAALSRDRARRRDRDWDASCPRPPRSGCSTTSTSCFPSSSGPRCGSAAAGRR